MALSPYHAHPFAFHQPIHARQARLRPPTSCSQYAVSMEKVCILDGSNYNVIDLFISAEGNAPFQTSNMVDGETIGILKVVVGSTPGDEPSKNSQRIIGFAVAPDKVRETSSIKMKTRQGEDVYLSLDSIANVPRDISDEDAIATAVAALSGVHCAFFDPVREEDYVLKKVGGSEEDFILLDSDETTLLMKQPKKKIVVLGGGDYASFVSE